VIITTRNLLHYLLAKDLVSAQSVVNGDFAVINVTGRNRNFKVLRGEGPSYFVKQTKNWDAQAIAMLQCEAVCYWLARNVSEFSCLRRLTPEFLFYDPERQVLITKLITNGEDLWEHFRRLGKISSEVSSALGDLLGSYHCVANNFINESPHGSIFPRQIPWILSSERRNSHPFKELSPATVALFDRVESSADFRSVLDELREDWDTSALMHGDLKLENCILSHNGSDSSFSFTIIDWELADIGDPCWDVAGILQAFITAHTMSLPATDAQISIRDLLSTTSGTELRESLSSFWRYYVLKLGVDSSTSSKLLERCLRYGAARMIQSAYEYMQFSPHLSINAIHLLELSEDLVRNTTDSAELLL
jgi:hypothetical protein